MPKPNNAKHVQHPKERFVVTGRAKVGAELGRPGTKLQPEFRAFGGSWPTLAEARRFIHEQGSRANSYTVYREGLAPKEPLAYKERWIWSTESEPGRWKDVHYRDSGGCALPACLA